MLYGVFKKNGIVCKMYALLCTLWLDTILYPVEFTYLHTEIERWYKYIHTQVFISTIHAVVIINLKNLYHYFILTYKYQVCVWIQLFWADELLAYICIYGTMYDKINLITTTTEFCINVAHTFIGNIYVIMLR